MEQSRSEQKSRRESREASFLSLFWTFLCFFCLPAARVRVPGGSPFSQLQLYDEDYPAFVKSNKNVHDHWPEQWNEANKQIQEFIKNYSSADECVRDGRSIPEIASSMVHKKKEDRRREAIGLEIPVTRGAFDRRKEAPMTYCITKQGSTLAVKCSGPFCDSSWPGLHVTFFLMYHINL